jgi:biopolymer transport protein ExbD
MAFSSGSGGGGPMAEINVTPLVDVMLVLLIIFMITAPLMAHKVKIELPEAELLDRKDEPGRPITLALKEDGEIFWNDEKVQMAVLESQLAVEAQKKPQPRIDIRADKTTKYKLINEVVKTAKNVGIAKVGFVATPDR